MQHNHTDCRLIIGLDIDGTLDESPEFFVAISHTPGFRVIILTGREPSSLEAAQLADLGIRYDEIAYADKWHDKGRICVEKEIDILFEDQDEYIAHIPESTLVFKVRNGGNFDFITKTWYH